MKITVSDSDTFEALAERYAVDSVTAESIASHNGWPIGSEVVVDNLAFVVEASTPVYLLSEEIEIPDAWLRNTTTQKKSITPLLVVGGLLVATLAILDTRRLFR